jgi:hypothetical protein
MLNSYRSSNTPLINPTNRHNITVSQPLVGFVPEPNHGRGTISILWSCLMTIFLCSHATYPHPRLVLTTTFSHLKDRAFFTFGGFLLPELLLCGARRKLHKARRVHRLCQDLGWREATLPQAFLLVTGVVQVNDRYGSHPITLRQPGLVGFLHEDYREGFVAKFPTPAMVDATLVRDGLLAIITFGQCGYLLTNFVVRIVQGMAYGLLESLTCAFVCMTVLIASYGQSNPTGYVAPLFLNIDLNILAEENEDGVSWGSEDEEFEGGELWLWTCTSLSVTGLLLAAWNSTFPSRVEMWMWRGGCLTCLAAGLCGNFSLWRNPTLMPRVGGDGRESGTEVKWRRVKDFLVVLPVAVLMMARFLLFGVACVSLRGSVRSLYEGIWWLEYWGRFGA